jgi:hypothetical protein
MSVAVLLAVALSGTVTPSPRPSDTAAAAGRAVEQSTATTPTDALAGTGATGMAILLGIALLIVYVGSLALHPNAKCGRCKGVGRHRGSIFSYATRPGSSCKGRGTHPRLGRKIFFRGSD